ncbi:MAG: LysM peptidoglycan-binding domain-containing protein [Oligosphaeraceae bacterium]|nr:LysM peptidoglycan-binding domain-containing protein [Oligosphaeraceae bacterium]
MKNSFRLKNTCVLTAVGLLLLAFTACKSKTQNLNDGVLGSRNMLPPPYVKPFEPVAEPLPPAPVVPAGVTEVAEPLPNSAQPFVPAEVPTYVPTGEIAAPEQALVTPPSPPDVKPVKPQIKTPVVTEPAKSLRTHTVRAGETMGSIAACVGVRWQDIAAANPSVNPNRMKIGTKLNLPSTASDAPIVAPKRKPKAQTSGSSSNNTSASKGSKGSSAPAIPADGIYVVAPNDSVWKISRRFKIKEKDIRAWNNLSGENPPLQVGQKLQLRGIASAPAATAAPAAAAAPAAVEGPAAPAAGAAAGPLEAVNNLDAAAPATPQPDVVGTVNEETVPVQETTITHTVQAGETLDGIALFYEITTADLLKANPTVKTDADLTAGMILRVQYTKK